MAANRNKAGAPFQYAESLFAALAAVKSMTGLPYRHLQGMLIETLGDWDTPCYTTAPDARHGEAPDVAAASCRQAQTCP